MAKLVVSTWHRDSFGQQLHKYTSDRINRLRAALKTTAAKIAAKNYESSGLIKGIFVAPEYFFAEKWAGLKLQNGKRSSRPISQATHDSLLTKLVQISRAYPRILIVPGTVAWKKPFDFNEMLARVKYYEGRAKHQKPLEGEALMRGLRSEYHRSQLDQTLVDAYTRYQYEASKGHPMPTSVLSDQELEQIRTNDPVLFGAMTATVNARYDSLGSAAADAVQRLSTMSTIRYAMQNTAYAFLNGNVVFTYAKQGNFHEEADDPGLVFLPGAKSGVQEIEGIRFGFEVCLDHNIGTLSRQLRNNRQVDVQVVASDYVGFDPAHAVVREGGFFIHGSTNPALNGVWQISNHKPTKSPSLGMDTVYGSQLTHWEMEIDVHDPFALEGTFMADLPGRPTQKWASVQAAKSPFRTRG